MIDALRTRKSHPPSVAWNRCTIDSTNVDERRHSRARYENPDPRWVMLAARDNDAFTRLCRTAGRDDLAADPRFATVEARAEHRLELEELLAALFATSTAPEWEAALCAAGVGCVVADDMSHFRLYRDQQARNAMMTTVEHPSKGTYWRYAGPHAVDTPESSPDLLRAASTHLLRRRARRRRTTPARRRCRRFCPPKARGHARGVRAPTAHAQTQISMTSSTIDIGTVNGSSPTPRRGAPECRPPSAASRRASHPPNPATRGRVRHGRVKCAERARGWRGTSTERPTRRSPMNDASSSGGRSWPPHTIRDWPNGSTALARMPWHPTAMTFVRPKTPARE